MKKLGTKTQRAAASRVARSFRAWMRMAERDTRKGDCAAAEHSLKRAHDDVSSAFSKAGKSLSTRAFNAMQSRYSKARSKHNQACATYLRNRYGR